MQFVCPDKTHALNLSLSSSPLRRQFDYVSGEKILYNQTTGEEVDFGLNLLSVRRWVWPHAFCHLEKGLVKL